MAHAPETRLSENFSRVCVWMAHQKGSRTVLTALPTAGMLLKGFIKENDFETENVLRF